MVVLVRNFCTPNFFSADFLLETFVDILIRAFGIVEQVVVLGLMIVSTAASSIGLSELRGINVSMYIRLLVPIVFSRYVRGASFVL